MRRRYLLQHEKYRTFQNIQILSHERGQYLSYRVRVPASKQYIDVSVDTNVPTEVRMILSDPGIPPSFLDHLYEDLFLMVQMFEETRGVSVQDSKVRFLGKTMELDVSLDMLGRVFTGAGLPKDSGPKIVPEAKLDINGNPPQDNYSFYTDGFDTDAYITTAYGANFDLSLAAQGSKTFDLCLNLGNLSGNHSAQTTTIFFQGTQV